jgi:hypothetical protein
VCILRDQDFLCAMFLEDLRGNRGERGHRYDAETGAEGKTLRNRSRDAQPDERSGSVTEDDSIEIAERHACLAEDFPDHRHEQPCVFTRLFLVTFDEHFAKLQRSRTGH